MSLYFAIPQCMARPQLNIGDVYPRPNKLFPCKYDPPPYNGDLEIIQEVEGIIDNLIYDQGTETGFVLVQQS